MIRRFGRFGRAACLCGWCGLCCWFWLCGPRRFVRLVRFVLVCAVVRHEGLLVLPATVSSPVLSVAMAFVDSCEARSAECVGYSLPALSLSLSVCLSVCLPVRLFNATPVCGGEKLCVSALHRKQEALEAREGRVGAPK